jgi:hypothetical protein
MTEPKLDLRGKYQRHKTCVARVGIYMTKEEDIQLNKMCEQLKENKTQIIKRALYGLFINTFNNKE